MPAAYLHEIIAERTRKLLNIDFIEISRPAYDAGAQGPDVLFFYRQLSLLKGDKLNNLGKMMHSEKCIEFLINLIKAAKDTNAAMAYCCGFISHYSTDSVIHPYVTAMMQEADRGHSTNIAHMKLEAELDAWIYREQGLSGIPKQASALSKLDEESKMTVSHVLSDSIRHTYPEQYSDQKALYKCFDHMRYVVNFLYSPRGIKYSIISLFEKLAGHPGYLTCHMVPKHLPEYDFLNLAKADWEHPEIKGQIQNYSLPELIDMSVQKSALLIKHANEFFADLSSLEGFIKAAGKFDYAGAPLT